MSFVTEFDKNAPAAALAQISRAHNSVMLESLSSKIVFCSSTTDVMCEVSLQSYKKCGSSSLHILIPFYEDKPMPD